MTIQEKRLHRCCFTGHRPEKLQANEETVKAWLGKNIDQAVTDGYTTFITGMGMGVDIWAGQLVVEKRSANPDLHLIAAVPWPGFSSKWKDIWRFQYEELIKAADLVVTVRNAYEDRVFQSRNEWMVDHCNRVIAYFNGEQGGTLSTINYALKNKIEVYSGGMIPDFNTYVAYDLETTGLSAKQDDIIEIGAVRVVDGKETDTFQKLARPEKKEISRMITELTGISQEDVAGARSIGEVMSDFDAFVGKDVLVGFNNVSFDSQFLEAAGVRMKNRQFDVMLYAMQHQKALGFERPRVSLKLLSERLKIINPRAHRALADALTTSRCFEKLRSLDAEE